MTLVTLVATRHISLTVLVMLANFLLLKQGLNAATRPNRQRRRHCAFCLISVASVVCLVAAAGVLQLISPRSIEVVGDAEYRRRCVPRHWTLSELSRHHRLNRGKAERTMTPGRLGTLDLRRSPSELPRLSPSRNLQLACIRSALRSTRGRPPWASHLHGGHTFPCKPSWTVLPSQNCSSCTVRSVQSKWSNRLRAVHNTTASLNYRVKNHWTPNILDVA